MPKLKICPFCSSDDLSEEATGVLEIRGTAYQTCWIECLNCGCQGPNIELHDGTSTEPKIDYQIVRDAWNERSN